MQCPALGSGGGQRADREPGRPARPVTRGLVADGPRPRADAHANAHANAHAGADSAGTSAVAGPGTSARGNAAPGARPGADAPAGAVARADLDAPCPGLAVAFPVGTAAAVARRQRRLASPRTLVGGAALSPAALVVMTGIDAAVARRARRR